MAWPCCCPPLGSSGQFSVGLASGCRCVDGLPRERYDVLVENLATGIFSDTPCAECELLNGVYRVTYWPHDLDSDGFPFPGVLPDSPSSECYLLGIFSGRWLLEGSFACGANRALLTFCCPGGDAAAAWGWRFRLYTAGVDEPVAYFPNGGWGNEFQPCFSGVQMQAMFGWACESAAFPAETARATTFPVL